MVKAGLFLENVKVYKPENLIEAPVISVILPTYCRGDNGLLERAINSVLNQTFRQLELIIIDDGSTDGTQSLAQKILNSDNRVIYIKNYINSGLPALRVNQGFMYARGKYIAYQFDDDYWESDALESLYNAIKNETMCLVYGKCVIKDIKNNRNIYIGDEFNYARLIEGNCVAANSVLHHRAVIDNYGAADCHLTMRRLCDWDLWLRWSKNIPFIFVDKNVSLVEAGQDNSLGCTCVLDSMVFRLQNAQDRNNRLKLENVTEYEIDNLDFITDEKEKLVVYNRHILPWHLSKRYIIGENNCHYLSSNKKNVLITKLAYSTCIDSALFNFHKLLPDDYNMIYVPEIQLTREMADYADIVIFHKTCNLPSSKIMEYAAGKPRLYFMDDDMVNYYKLGSEFNYLSPGTDMYNQLIYQLKNADLIVTYSDKLTEVARSYNKNIVQLETNIMAKYIRNDIKKDNKICKIAFIGGAARKEEIKYLWEDIVSVSNKYKDVVEFHFWGFIPENIGDIKYSNVYKVKHTYSYYEYLDRLSKENFDIVLSPLFAGEVKDGKCPMKYLEATVCGAVGLYSDVTSYMDIIDGVTGFKLKMKRDFGKIR